MFMDILTFLGLDYGVATLIKLYFVVPGINIPKNKTNRIIRSHKNSLLKSKKIIMLKIVPNY